MKQNVTRTKAVGKEKKHTQGQQQDSFFNLSSGKGAIQRQQSPFTGSSGQPFFSKKNYSNHFSPLQAKSDTAQANADAPKAKPENNTGMPDHLKSGIEQLSGYSLDDVKVHRNSAKPAQLQAHAYAQGSDIHLAAGQEKHLPHEAWHVVQQKQGRVQPTMQMKDKVNVNDDVGLEKEADIMGEKAFQVVNNGHEVVAQPKLQSMADSSSHVFQRTAYPYRDTTKSKLMGNIAGYLSADVDTAKAIVDANPLLIGVNGRDGGYLNTWVVAFQEFLDTGEVPNFFYARYGYAIETLATGFFKARDIKPYKAHDQITYGATRPDFVIQQNGSDVAWLDITSEGSPGHIFNKQGGGWKTKPYVAEIRYLMPRPDDFKKTASGKLTEDQLKKLNSASSARMEQAANLAKGRDSMAVYLSNALEAAFNKKGSSLSKQDAKQVIGGQCNLYLSKYVDKLTLNHAAGVMSSIETMEVGGESSSGASWAKWAFGSLGNTGIGRVLLADLGAGK